MITFKEQFDKLTRAYIADMVNPYFPCACFIGNLLNGTMEWSSARHYRTLGRSTLAPQQELYYVKQAIESIERESEGMYTAKEIVDLENLFLKTLEEETVGGVDFPTMEMFGHPKYEDALFKAFTVTLDALWGIHKSKGEIVDDFIFTKRKLETV